MSETKGRCSVAVVVVVRGVFSPGHLVLGVCSYARGEAKSMRMLVWVSISKLHACHARVLHEVCARRRSVCVRVDVGSTESQARFFPLFRLLESSDSAMLFDKAEKPSFSISREVRVG